VATTQVELVTPRGVLFSGQAEMVVCRTEGGDIAFLANHMAYLGAIEAGMLRIVGPGPSTPAPGQGSASHGEELRFEVADGFVEVHGSRVLAVCESAKSA